MRSFELLAAAYFVALALIAPFTPAERRKVWQVIVICAALVTTILASVHVAPIGVRVWSPHLYLVMAYWMPALLVEGPSSRRLEAWLIRADARLRTLAMAPRPWVTTVLETAYLACYVMVPIGFAIVWTLGDAVATTRFWIAVLGAGFVCYGSLPWLVSRPPRLTDPSQSLTPQSRAVRNFNLFILGRLSHGMNTCPSGHVAVSVAAALIVGSVSLPAGLMLGVIAVGVIGGAVAGGYHYLVDVVLGTVVGVVTALIAGIV